MRGRTNDFVVSEVRILKEKTLTVVIPLRIKLRGGRKTMVTNGVMALEGRQDITLIKAVARAFRWRGMLESGAFTTINELAAAEKINPSYVSRVLRLTLLVPEMVEAILDGRQPKGVTLPGLLEGVPVGWVQQRSPFAVCLLLPIVKNQD